ncbi:hypothetical protein JCM11641_003776 [Rhodosporidiobolus odoratus]
MSFTRGHRKQESSFGGGYGSTLPPLTISNTLALHLGFAIQGAQDAAKLTAAGQKVASDKVVQANVLKNTVVQGILLASAVVIKPLLRRAVGLRVDQGLTSSIFYLGFHLFWLYPLAAAATYYSGLLQATGETDKRGMGSRSAASSGDKGTTAKLVADSYRTLVTLNYFLFFYALRLIPFLGAPLSFIYASIVDAYYCFEGHWVRNGWPFGDRVRHIEQRWAYAFGFGFPITFLSWWSSDPIVNLSLFALLYPFFQLTSTVSIPSPLDPTYPSTSSSAPSFLHSASGMGHGSFSIAAAEGGEENRGRKGSALVPVRIRVLPVAQVVYAALSAAFGTGSSGGGRKKDAFGGGGGGGGGGHGHHGHGYGGRAAAAAARERFDAGYGAPVQDVYGGQPTGYGGAAAGGVPLAGSVASPYAQPNAYDPYGSSPATYAGVGGGGAQATPPRRGYAAPGEQSEYGGSPAGSTMSGYGSYAPPPPAPSSVAPPPQAGSGGMGGYAPGVASSSGFGGYGGGKGFEGLLRQAGARGGKKSD